METILKFFYQEVMQNKFNTVVLHLVCTDYFTSKLFQRISRGKQAIWASIRRKKLSIRCWEGTMKRQKSCRLKKGANMGLFGRFPFDIKVTSEKLTAFVMIKIFLGAESCFYQF